MSKGAQIAIGALLVASLLGWYGYTNLEDGSTFQYYQTLEEFRAAGTSTGSRALRIHGYVSNDSIVRDVEGKRVLFGVQNDPPHGGAGPQIPLRVLYPSLETPDLFQDGAEVVVEGRLAEHDGQEVFVADNVLAKCPSKFEAKLPGETASQKI